MGHTRCQTIFPNRLQSSTDVLTTVNVLNIVIAVVNIGSNAWLIYAVKKTRQHNRTSTKFVRVLAFADLLIGIIYQPLVAAVISAYASINCTFELTVQFFGYVIMQYSAFMVSIVALDRYIHMKYLNRYSTLMTPSRANKLLLFNCKLFGEICSLKYRVQIKRERI